ncbi:signal peptide peptidase SppA [uncultured Methylovirgula sp.]|uniref:signal peptide peptidase SppA n=1 Tax=uncultured Methylovirgula sp. TaxID=1285960 RepID=UPI0026153CAE|nr:signal peptide peptidase SppA [uncultured Methylovirgula sp.]
MSNTSPADYIVDRRLLQRKLSFWRLVSILLLIAGLVLIGLRFSGRANFGSQHIARISISGLITGDRATLKLINDVSNSNAKAVILAVDSPGGTTTGAEKLFIALRRLAAKKPTVAVVGTMAASGAYIAALGADHIVSPGNALVGSIGVLFQYPDLSGLLGKVGVKVDSVKSSPLKAEPSGFEPTSPEVRAALASLVADSYTWFKDLVKTRRGMTDAQLAAVDDGRVFTGRQAIGLKLVDEIGEEREAVAWLERVKKVPHGLPVRDWSTKNSLQKLGIISSSAKIADALGFSWLAHVLGGTETYAQGQLLDGLVAIWQVGPTN